VAEPTGALGQADRQRRERPVARAAWALKYQAAVIGERAFARSRVGGQDVAAEAEAVRGEVVAQHTLIGLLSGPVTSEETELALERTLVFPATNEVEILTHRRPVARSGRRGRRVGPGARRGGAAYFPFRSRLDTVNLTERHRQQAVPARPLAACQKGLRPRDRPSRTALLPFQIVAILPLRKGGKYFHADRPSSL
jgi:hypothetical protein